MGLMHSVTQVYTRFGRPQHCLDLCSDHYPTWDQWTTSLWVVQYLEGYAFTEIHVATITPY